jgi:hypothetical protein
MYLFISEQKNLVWYTNCGYNVRKIFMPYLLFCVVLRQDMTLCSLTRALIRDANQELLKSLANEVRHGNPVRKTRQKGGQLALELAPHPPSVNALPAQTKNRYMWAAASSSKLHAIVLVHLVA